MVLKMVETRAEAMSRGGRKGGKAPNHKWTDEDREIVRRDYRGTNASAQVIAAMLSRPGDRVTIWAVKGQVQKLDISMVKAQSWTRVEEEKLAELISCFELGVVARKIGRSVAAVSLKAKRLGLSRRAKNGWYTKKDVCHILGVDHHWLQTRIDSGVLPAAYNRPELRPSHRGGSYWRIQEEDLRAFIRRHPLDLMGRNIDIFQVVDILVGVEV